MSDVLDLQHWQKASQKMLQMKQIVKTETDCINKNWHTCLRKADPTGH